MRGELRQPQQQHEHRDQHQQGKQQARAQAGGCRRLPVCFRGLLIESTFRLPTRSAFDVPGQASRRFCAGSAVPTGLRDKLLHLTWSPR